MQNTSISPKKTNDALGKVLALVRGDMERVDQQILSQAGSHVELIPEITRHLVESGGKRIRPLLTLACARLFGYSGEDHIIMATSIEFMHTATLLHDDVVDESDLRRGRKTARLLWGNQASVLVGDFLLGQAFKMMVSVGKLDALDSLASAAATIAEGEVLQLTSVYNLAMDEPSYRKVIDAKTAALFVAACEMGPILAGKSEKERRSLAAFGKHLGLAFQLSDDVLDYTRDGSLGKNVGDDFIEGKVTLPVILAYQAGSAPERKFWQEAFSPEAERGPMLEKAISLIIASGARDLCASRALEEAKKAELALQDIAPNAFHQGLIEVAYFAAERCCGNASIS